MFGFVPARLLLGFGLAVQLDGAEMTSSREDTEWVQHDQFMCKVKDLAYDFAKKTGTLHMAPADCCDMQGCVDLFERIDPRVRRIETFAGDKVDTIYVRERGKDWRAIL